MQNVFDEDLVSIIVPVYNTGHYLKYCIESLLMQSYKNIEIILVDDGSTDKSGEICNDYREKDSRIKVIHMENSGVSAARNRGLDEASGVYIGFVDSDDYIHPRMYEKLLELIKTNAAEISIGCFTFVQESENIFDTNMEGSVIETCSGKQALWNLLSKDEILNTGLVCDKLFAKRLFSNVRFPQGRRHEDDCVIHELFSLADGVVYSNYVLYYYRHSFMSEYSISNLDLVYAYECRLNYYHQKGYEDLYQATILRYLHILQYNYFQMLKKYPDEKKKRIALTKKVDKILNSTETHLPVNRKKEYKVFSKNPLLYKLLQKMHIFRRE